MEFNNNKFFVDIKKRELTRFQGYALNEWGWSPKRIRRVKSTLSSMSNYIENILQDEDDKLEDFCSIIGKIESPSNEAVREKSVIPDEDVDKLFTDIKNMVELSKNRVYKTVIPRNVRVSEAPSYGMAITEYDPKSRGAEAYRDFAEEFLEWEESL